MSEELKEILDGVRKALEDLRRRIEAQEREIEELRLRVVPLASREAMELGLYWFRDEDLLEPVDWDYVKTLPVRVRVALEAYMRGEVSIGKAAEISGLGLRRFEEIRARARIPIRAPRLPEDFKRELAGVKRVV